MRLVEYGIDEWTGPVRLVFVGDLHLGHAQTREGMIADLATSLGQKNTYWFDLGDSIDAINMRDPRFDPRSLPEWIGIRDLVDLPHVQVARYRHYFRDHGKTCLAKLYGNHEQTLQKYFERDIYRELCQAIALPKERRLGYSGYVRLRFRYRAGKDNKVVETWTQNIYLSHGSGGGMLAGAKALRLERLPMAHDADIYAVGHTHTKLTLRKRRTTPSPKKNEVSEQSQIFINVGSYLDGTKGYPEYKGYYPQELGHVELWVWPKAREIKIIG